MNIDRFIKYDKLLEYNVVNPFMRAFHSTLILSLHQIPEHQMNNGSADNCFQMLPSNNFVGIIPV